MNFHVKQDVVCVETYGHRLLKKDAVYTVRAIRTTPCKCGGIDLDVGLNLLDNDVVCTLCGYGEIQADTTFWADQKCFAPLDTLCDISELTEHLENTTAFEQ